MFDINLLFINYFITRIIKFYLQFFSDKLKIL